MLLVTPSKGFVVFVDLQQVCIPDLNPMCIVKIKQGCLSPFANVLFGAITSKEAKR